MLFKAKQTHMKRKSSKDNLAEKELTYGNEGVWGFSSMQRPLNCVISLLKQHLLGLALRRSG